MSYANRGKGLEQMIEYSNNVYRQKGVATVQKIPTPVKVLNVNRNGKLTGFYEKKSTVDYIGVWQGTGICFDAKETKIETRFDLSNVKDHQYGYMKDWHESGGLSFLIVSFVTLDEIYYLPFEKLRYWKEEADRKSIPYDEFEWAIHKTSVPVDYSELLHHHKNYKEVD